MDSTGHNHCSHYSEDGAEVILVLTSFRNFSAKTGRREGLEVCYRYITGTVAVLPLQDSRPHVLFGTVIVKHLLDLISSCPQPVQFFRLDFGDAHRGRAIRIQSGGNQRVCNFQDVLKLFFKRPPSFCIHWRFSLSPIVKRRPTATSLGCPFSFQCADSLPELAFCAEIPHD